MFAYIPARIGSKRIPKKNIRVLGGKPVIQHVIEAIAQVDEIEGIAVSTDSNEVVKIVESLPKVTTLGLRNARLAEDQVTFLDLIRDDVSRFHAYFKGSDVFFCTATCALISAKFFKEGVRTYRNAGGRGLTLSVSPFETSAYLAMTEEIEGVKAWFPEKYLVPTKDLKPTYYDNGSFCIFNYDQFLQIPNLKTLLDLKPLQILPVPKNMGIDVDDEADWERLEYFYQRSKQI